MLRLAGSCFNMETQIYFKHIHVTRAEHQATFRNALELSQGINHDVYPKGIINVIVNGEIAVDARAQIVINKDFS
jgi:hypothetical protein